MSTKRIGPTLECKNPGLYMAFTLGSISGILILFGSRMFLNLKEAGGSRSKGATSPNRNTITTISALRFANSLLHSRMYISLILTLTLYFTDSIRCKRVGNIYVNEFSSVKVTFSYYDWLVLNHSWLWYSQTLFIIQLSILIYHIYFVRLLCMYLNSL